ncbi:hypothetical protein CTI14_00585 [Methylobacterium radiotolerans]|nr:hypothetical protein CTI14_00585 [Methylobacterium radiotolerans]
MVIMTSETPGQTIDLQAELDDLLCIALDGADADRVRYLIKFMALRQDPRSDADHARVRETMAAIFRPI